MQTREESREAAEYLNKLFAQYEEEDALKAKEAAAKQPILENKKQSAYERLKAIIIKQRKKSIPKTMYGVTK